MKTLQKPFVAIFALIVFLIPATSFANSNGYYTGSTPSPIHVGQYVTLNFTGSQYDNGYQVNYLDVYADGRFICTTSYSNNTPYWSCPASFSKSGDYVVTGTAHLSGGGSDPYYLQGIITVMQ